MKISKLEKTLACCAGGIALIAPLFFRPTAPHTAAERILGPTKPLINNPCITPYIGNLPDTFAVCAASGFLGDYIESVGNARNNSFLKKVGRYFPEITAVLTTTYFTLGETILPKILPGVNDFRDVPFTILGALAGYTLANLGRKSGLNNKIYSEIANINRKLEEGK